jgi:lipid-binding SYLF domain-containing protein
LLHDPAAVEEMKAGTFKLGAETSLVVLTEGAAAAARAASGTTVFVEPHGGLMAGISVSGQQIGYRPLTAMR